MKDFKENCRAISILMQIGSPYMKTYHFSDRISSTETYFEWKLLRKIKQTVYVLYNFPVSLANSEITKHKWKNNPQLLSYAYFS